MDQTIDNIPGTVLLVNTADHEAGSHASGNKNDVVLMPTPSDDPEDPLRWSRKRKFWGLIMTLVYTLGVGIPTTLHYSVIADITADTGISTAQLVQGNGVMFLFLGWGCIIWQPLALTYGRRGVYLVSMLLTIPIMVWTAYSSSAGEWYAHRTIIGLVCAPIESLPEISISDLFFAHERGTWMSVYVLVLFESNLIAPLIAGWFNDAFGWRWTMFLGAFVAAAAFMILFFGVEETMYIRNTVEGVEVRADKGEEIPEKKGERTTTDTAGDDSSSNKQFTPATIHTIPRTYLQKLAPFTALPGRPSNKQMLNMTLRPLAIIFRFPNIAWAGFIYGINLSWYLVLNGTTSPILSGPPYNWSSALIGTVYVGPMIGAIFGCLWGGAIADRLALYLARRNAGIREPEQRLWQLALAGVFSAAGLVTWGVGAHYGVHWAGLVFGLGMLVFGLIVGGSVGISYAVDCFKGIAGESMASVMVVRNTIGFGFSYAITPWHEGMGLRDCFVTAGFVSLACMATFLGMIWKGKALRRWSAGAYWGYVGSSAFESAH